MITLHLFNPYIKKSSLQLNKAKHRHFFGALGPDTEKQIKLGEKSL